MVHLASFKAKTQSRVINARFTCVSVGTWQVATYLYVGAKKQYGSPVRAKCN